MRTAAMRARTTRTRLESTTEQSACRRRRPRASHRCRTGKSRSGGQHAPRLGRQRRERFGVGQIFEAEGIERNLGPSSPPTSPRFRHAASRLYLTPRRQPSSRPPRTRRVAFRLRQYGLCGERQYVRRAAAAALTRAPCEDRQYVDTGSTRWLTRRIELRATWTIRPNSADPAVSTRGRDCVRRGRFQDAGVRSRAQCDGHRRDGANSDYVHRPRPAAWGRGAHHDARHRRLRPAERSSPSSAANITRGQGDARRFHTATRAMRLR
jgi:hypothetical protein